MSTPTITDSAVLGRFAADDLWRGFVVRDAAGLAEFLGAHPELLPLLADLGPAVRAVFGAETSIALEVYRDPEAIGHRELYALVQTSFDPDESLRRLDAFDDDWWLDAMPHAGGLLSVSLVNV